MFQRRNVLLYLLLGGILLVPTALIHAEGPVIINEIHFDPDVETEEVEFIELYNTNTVSVDVSGWAFTEGVSYVIPNGTVIPAGGYLVVCEDPPEFQAKFGGSALGPWIGKLSNEGEEIELRDAANEVIDRVDYQLGFPWPIVGNEPGFSIELVHPSLDNDLGGSWRASIVGGFVAPPGSTLVPRVDNWRYFKGITEASSPDNTAWREVGFDDSSWLTGNTPIFYENSSGYSGGTDLTGDMSGNYSTVYMRRTFNVADPSIFGSLEVSVEADDGAIVWINGVEVARLGANGGQIPNNGTANSSSGEPKMSTESINNPANILVPGNNVIAVHALNASLSGSSDFFITASVVGLEGTSGAGPSPGGLNVVTATNIPPQLRQADHSPNEPASNEPVLITIKATDPDGVADVTLHYQLVNPGNYIELTDAAFLTSWVDVPMNDNGTGGDEEAGDDVYSYLMPANLQVHRRLIRYRFTATDNTGRSIVAPFNGDLASAASSENGEIPAPNFAYFVYDGIPAWQGSIRPGSEPVLTYPAEEMSRLPAYHLVSKQSDVEDCTWLSRYGGDEYRWTGTLVYDGRIYDHIHYRARGGVWRYSMCKNMWKFLFNRGNYFQARDNWGDKYKTRWRRLNLGASIQQGNFNHRGEQGMFESTGFRMFNLAGVQAPNSTFITLRIVDEAEESFPNDQFEGDFWGVYLALEQMDGRFLSEHDLPDGNLYKMENGTGPGDGSLKNQGPDGVGGNADVVAFRNELNNSQPVQWWRDNVELQNYYSYYMVVLGIHHYDICCGKNFYWYFHPDTGRLHTLPWDLDLTWADNMYLAGDGGTDRIFDNGRPFDKAELRLELGNRVREFLDLFYNDEQGHRLLDEYAGLLEGTNSLSVLSADRAMWDYNPKMVNSTYTRDPGSKAGHGRFYQAGTPTKDFRGMVQKMKNYVTTRATATSYQSGTPLIVWATDSQIPATPIVTYIGPGGFPLNELRFRVSNFSGGNSFAALKWRIAEITPTNAPAFNPNRPNKYEIESVWDSGELSQFNSDIVIPPNVVRAGSVYRVRARFKDQTGRWSHWSAPVEFTTGQPLSSLLMLAHLRMTEVMYNAPEGGEYDFVELHNRSTDTELQLGGAKFTQGIDYLFPEGTTIPPLGYLLLTKHPDLNAFKAHYGITDTNVTVLGPYDGNLSNEGEELKLRTSAGGTDVAVFEYNDSRGWPLPADGSGHSLVPLVLDTQIGGELNYGGNWRASTHIQGSPGQADPPVTDVLTINEVAAHTDFPLPPPEDSNDWIELRNNGPTQLTLGPGWYLSDSREKTNLTKWMIPSGTVIPAGGVVSFDERNQFHDPVTTGFGLNKAGEAVLLSYLPGTAEDRVVDSVRFKGQENDYSLGRLPGAGPWWHALTPTTRDAANTAAPLGVVITEIMYHPVDIIPGSDNDLDEFIEIFNPTGSPVDLFNTNGAWRLDGGVQMDFPNTLTLAPMSYVLAVNFDPADLGAVEDFWDAFGLDDHGTPLVGPYAGKLDNSVDRVALEKPQSGDFPDTDINWVIVDEVIYADKSPWPQGADGIGPSLQRTDVMRHGNDPANWAGAAPSPADAYTGGESPSITTHPGPADSVVRAGTNLTYTVVATGPGDLSYQWLKDDRPVAGATGSTLELSLLQPPDSGRYRVVVMNAAGSIVSEEAALLVTTPPRILSQPESYIVDPGDNVTLSVTATGSGPLTYVWQFNGNVIQGADQPFLSLNNVQAADDGTYTVAVIDMNGLVFSEPALVTVLLPPEFVVHPLSQTVVEGEDVTFSVVTTGSLPMGYRWRQGSSTAKNEVTRSRQSFFTLENVQMSDGGSAKRITCVITNAAFFQPGRLSRSAILTVLADSDGDRMPDDWETANGLNPNDPSDANGDLDGDGQTNQGEFLAGTDPNDPTSFLKIETIEADFVQEGSVRLSFLAKTNRTYSIQFRDSLQPGIWNKLEDVVASPTNRMVEITDQPSSVITQRYYRLVTPRQETQ